MGGVSEIWVGPGEWLHIVVNLRVEPNYLVFSVTLSNCRNDGSLYRISGKVLEKFKNVQELKDEQIMNDSVTDHPANSTRVSTSFVYTEATEVCSIKKLTSTRMSPD